MTTLIHQFPTQRNVDYVVRARSILKNLRTWFEIRGWEVIPRDKRRYSRLQWLADHACLANPKDQKRAVRRVCLEMAPDLSDDDLAELFAYTRTSNKRWTPDHSAMVWDIGVRDRERYQLWYFGACDDINYDRRIELNKAKDAQRKKDERAAKRTGRPRGRPRLDMTEEERREHDRVLAAKRQRKRREMSRLNPSAAIRKITPDGINRDTPPSPVSAPPIILKSPPLVPARAPQSAPRADDDTDDDVIDDGGVALAPRLIQTGVHLGGVK